MLEARVEKRLATLVKAKGPGYHLRKVQWVGRRGAPDRFLMTPGQSPNWWIELKRPGKDAEDHQAREHKRMRACGERVIVLDTIEKVEDFMRLLP